MKRSLVRYISHEIRTPLNIVLLGLKVLHREMNVPNMSPKDHEKLQTVKDIADASDIAVNILDSLLAYDNLEQRTYKLILSDIQITKFVLDTVQPFFVQVINNSISAPVIITR